MDCAFDDDRTIVAAMVDFAICAIFGLIYSKNSKLQQLSSPTVFRPQPQSWGPIELGCPSVRLSVRPSVRLSVIAFLYGLELLNGRS